jgi:hypothetical protein
VLISSSEANIKSAKIEDNGDSALPSTLGPFWTDAPYGPKRLRMYHEMMDLVGDSARSLTKEEWRLMKTRYWTASLNSPLEGVPSDTLGSSVVDLLKPYLSQQWAVAQALEGRFTDITNEKEQEFLMMFNLLGTMTVGKGAASIPNALIERIGDPKITRGDLFLYEILRDAFVESPAEKHATPTEVETWKALAKSTNALCRLLALQLFSRVTAQPDQWLEFYRGYISEADHGIRQEAANLIFQARVPGKSAALLSEIRTRREEGMDTEELQNLNAKIDFLEKRVP